jgi:glycosyltransferase involved in cell wall biosynthesis
VAVSPGPSAAPAPAGPGHLAALCQRLGAVAEVLGVDGGPPADDVATTTSRLFGRLVDDVHARTGTEELWLLMTAVSGAMPDSEELQAAARARDLTDSGDFARWLLEAGYEAAGARGSAGLEMDVVRDAVVVDVDFAAQHELHTGIQRVVRETVPRWHRQHAITLVAWTEPGGAMRRLTVPEEDRVLRWGDRKQRTDDDAPVRRARIVVPWRCAVLLPEYPQPEHCPMLAALSLYSGSSLGMVGYDAIPVISPDLIHTGLPDRFMRYLQAVKHASRVAGISAAATLEFRGFGDMLAAQGLPGPEVVECALPVHVPDGEAVPRAQPPLVVCVGSFEPRKNQLAVLHAAEQLWRQGLDFQLEFIGGGGYTTEFDPLMARLRRAGRPVRRRNGISDAELWRTLRSARFSAFLSLHEGFGLPVAESLACGTPCLTSHYGSTREIADGGGALVVDPLDDEAIAREMRRLLTDDALVARLRDEAARRPPRTWDDYARELWDALLPEFLLPDAGLAPAGTPLALHPGARR